ncbi:MAG: tetratricopeptide repeat protein, partial [Bacteroidota bacterium]
MLKRCLPLLVALWVGSWLNAQETTVYTEAYAAFKRAEVFFADGLFAKAQTEYRKTLDLLHPANHVEQRILNTQAELGYAQSAVRLEQPDAEKLILDFIRNNAPDPIANEALIELANYYFDTRDYDKAAQYLARVPVNGLSKEDRSSVQFRLGYAQFVKKDFTRAKANFQAIKDLETQYFYAANYYLGLCHFYEGNYDLAVRQFRLVERSNKYDDYIPYYTTQIYFAQRRFDELIAYAEPRLNDPKLKN